jgi:hypothetical protein
MGMNPVTWDETNGRIERQSGPPGNMNAFKHGLAAIQKRREEGIPTEYEGECQASDFGGIDCRQGR